MLRTVFIVLVLAGLSATASLCATTTGSASPARHRTHARSATARLGASTSHASHLAHTATARHRTTAAAHTHSSYGASRHGISRQIPYRYRYAGLHHPGVRPGNHPYPAPQFRFQSSYRAHSPTYSRWNPAPAPAPTVEAVSLPSPHFTTMPPPLRGSLESLTRQNRINDAEGLERILDEGDLVDRIEQHELVPVPASESLLVNGSLPEAHRYCRPWTARFLTDFASAHAARFHSPVLVNSAVRTVEYQKRLIRINGNAAAAEGELASPHLTGASVDIAKGTMSRQEIGWVRSWLLPLQAAGRLDVEEEFQQACFHITVYKTYASTAAPASPRRRPAVRAELASRGR